MGTPGPKRKPVKHGTAYAYSARGCRCQTCTDAWAAKCRADKEHRSAVGLAAGDPRHGTPYGYTAWGCRLPCCANAWSAYTAKLREEAKLT